MRLRCPFRQGESPRYCRCPKFRTDFLAREEAAGRAAVIHRRVKRRAPSFWYPATRLMADLDSSLFSQRPTLVRLIAAGSTEQTRNRVSTADRTRWFDQRVGADCGVLVSTTDKPFVVAHERLSQREVATAPWKIVDSDIPKW
jgi:hypothetical protein